MNKLCRAPRVGKIMLAGFALLLVNFQAGAQVMDQVPSDAVVVVKVNKLQATSTKIGDLMQALGIVDFLPAAKDPLAALEAQGGITDGVDKNGDAAIVMENGPWLTGDTNAGDPPPAVFLVPVTDYKTFLANVTVVSTEGETTTFHFKNDDKDHFAQNWGSFAAISPVKTALAKKPDGLKLTGISLKEMTEKDIAIFVNVPVLQTTVGPLLQKNREQILDSVTGFFTRMNQMGAPPADTDKPADKSPIVRMAANQVLNDVQEMLDQGQSQTMGLFIDKAGINGSSVTEFKPDTFWGKFVATGPATDKPLLGGLPAGKYMFVGGLIEDPEHTTEFVDHLLGTLPTDLASQGDTGKALSDLIASYHDVLGSVDSMAFGAIAPTGLGQGLFQIVGINKGDAQKLHDAQIKQFSKQAELMKMLGLKGAEMTKTTVIPNAKTVDGVQFDLLKTEFTPKQDDAMQMQQAQMMNIFYGGPAFNMYTGVVDPKTLLLVGSNDEQLLATSVASSKSNADVLTDNFKAVDAELPKSRAGAFYIPLDVIVSTGVSYARQFGFAMPVQIPPNLPPIGMSLSHEGSAVELDGHVPTELVQSLIQAGMQVYMQMKGGAAPGPNGGGGGGGL